MVEALHAPPPRTCCFADGSERATRRVRSVRDGESREGATPSLPWKFASDTRVHARSLATQFPLQIKLIRSTSMRRETSRMSFAMCPFCVRGLVSNSATEALAHARRRASPKSPPSSVAHVGRHVQSAGDAKRCTGSARDAML